MQNIPYIGETKWFCVILSSLVRNTDLRIRALTMTLQTLVYEYVCRSLFKADRLMFAMHLVHRMHPSLFQDLEWEAFIGQLVPEMFRRQESIKKMQHGLPSWCDSERTLAVNQFPQLGQNCHTGLLWQPDLLVIPPALKYYETSVPGTLVAPSDQVCSCLTTC